MNTADSYSYTIYTQYGREPLSDMLTLNEKLNRLAKEKQGFVRLQISPPLNNKRYIETTYDDTRKNYYVCILEDRENGQGFLELRTKRVPKKMYRCLFTKQNFGLFGLRRFYAKSTGLQKSIVPEGMAERLYMEPFEIKSEVFGEDWKYGGRQGNPMDTSPQSDEGRMLRSVVKKYFPAYNDEQIEAKLKKLGSEGCGYVIGVNAILSHFLGRAEEFEQKFGFPMYAPNGRLNYELLLVDYYSATDNHNLKLGADVINYNEDCMGAEKDRPYNYSLDETGYGTTDDSRSYRLKLYLKDKGINVNVKNGAVVNPGLIKGLIRKGYVHIALMGGNVQNEDGSTYLYCPGHSMLITGITNDCRYIVSTWGRKLYVDPNEVVEKDGKKTKIDYQYYELY